jgi:hypothetical protein
MKLFDIFSVISLWTLSVSAGFWDNVERTELYEMMEKSIPEMYVTLPENSWSEMIEKAQVEYQDERTGFGVEATLKFIYEGNEEEYDINFKLGGKSTATFSKPGYNIKIKGTNSTLHGTKNFRLRSDQRDVSMMRSKITTDILQKSGLIATEVGYTELYVNNEYMGFWVVSDSVKNKWIKRKFGDDGKEIKTLYECNGDVIRFDDGSAKTKCVNANEDYIDYMEPFINFVDQVNASTTREELEEIMDVDNFIKYMAWEWLMGSFDHFLSYYGHNLYWYQQPNGKWVYIPYDHDIELGQDEYIGFYPNRTFNHHGDIDFANLSFKDFELDHPIIQVLVHDDDTTFRELLGDIISKVFNPDTLLIHINKIRDIIAPYVKKDRDTGAGKINKLGKDSRFNYEHFLLNTEYTYVYDWISGFRSYGLKDWIRRRYNFAAAYYGINSNSTSSEEKHKLIEPRPEPIIFTYKTPVWYDITNITEMYYLAFNNVLPEYIPDETYEDVRVPILGVNQYNLERTNPSYTKPTTTKRRTTTTVKITTSTNVITTTTTTSTTTIITPIETCWSESLGYPCCSMGCNAINYYTDDDGFWGVENDDWCGIPSQCQKNDDDVCPGSNQGYSCCKTCEVYMTDETGPWNIENDEWCSVKTNC